MDSWNGNEDKVRVRAYHLWEAEGRPEGRGDEFWARALQLEQQESAVGQASAPPKAKKAKRAPTAKSSLAKPAKTLNASRSSESKKASKRRSSAIAAKDVAGSAAMHMQPASVDRS